MMQASSQPNTTPMKPENGIPDRSNLMTLLEAASSLDYIHDADVGTGLAKTAGESTSPSSSYNFLGKKKRPKKASSASTSTFVKKKKAANLTARPAAKLTLTQLLIASKKNGGTTTDADAASKKTTKKKEKTNNKPPRPTFPQELMRMVTDEANASIIAFLPCGKQFIILDQEAFLDEVLPKSALAMQTPSGGKPGKVKMSSFTRRLNRWGFLQCRVVGLENHLVFAHPKFLRDEPELCKEIKSGFVSTAAKLKALPRAAPAYAAAAAAAAKGRDQAQGIQVNNDGFKTPVIDASSSQASAPRTTVLVLPGNVYHRPVLKVKEAVVRSARASLSLPLVAGNAPSPAPLAATMIKPITNNKMEQELLLQSKYARLLRLQSNLQRKAVHTNFGIGDSTPITEGQGQAAGSTFLPHDAVMAATRTVTCGAMNTIRRDRSLFGQVSREPATANAQSSRPTSKLSRLREREMVLKRALAIALSSQQLRYNNQAA